MNIKNHIKEDFEGNITKYTYETQELNPEDFVTQNPLYYCNKQPIINLVQSLKDKEGRLIFKPIIIFRSGDNRATLRIYKNNDHKLNICHTKNEMLIEYNDLSSKNKRNERFLSGYKIKKNDGNTAIIYYDVKKENYIIPAGTGMFLLSTDEEVSINDEVYHFEERVNSKVKYLKRSIITTKNLQTNDMETYTKFIFDVGNKKMVVHFLGDNPNYSFCYEYDEKKDVYELGDFTKRAKLNYAFAVKNFEKKHQHELFNCVNFPKEFKELSKLQEFIAIHSTSNDTPYVPTNFGAQAKKKGKKQ